MEILTGFVADYSMYFIVGIIASIIISPVAAWTMPPRKFYAYLSAVFAFHFVLYSAYEFEKMSCDGPGCGMAIVVVSFLLMGSALYHGLLTLLYAIYYHVYACNHVGETA